MKEKTNFNAFSIVWIWNDKLKGKKEQKQKLIKTSEMIKIDKMTYIPRYIYILSYISSPKCH